MSDTISRQAAIDALDVLCQEHRYRIPGKVETYSQYNEAWQDALGRAEGVIGNLPSAQPELRWIPCSERLPEEGEIVLTQANIENMISLCVASRQDYNYWKGWNTREINVVAWMPLPEPYEEEKRNA